MLRVNLNKKSFRYRINEISSTILIFNILWFPIFYFDSGDWLKAYLDTSSSIITITIWLGITQCISHRIYLYEDVEYVFWILNVMFLLSAFGAFEVFYCDFFTPYTIFSIISILILLIPMLAIRYKRKETIFLCRVGLVLLFLFCLFLTGNAIFMIIKEGINITDIWLLFLILYLLNIPVAFKTTYGADFEKFIPKSERKIGTWGYVYIVLSIINPIFFVGSTIIGVFK